jgi:ornithine carbamoyltransferase
MIKHLLTLKELKPKDIENLIRLAIEVKNNPENYYDSLSRKTLAMIFQKTSTRTRVSFETAMTQLGGHAIYLDWMKTQLSMADLRDEIRVISRYADAIMARLFYHKDLAEMAKYSRVPVINGLTEKYHPCQILADLMTLKEKLGRLKGLKLAYFGVANNISNSLTLGCIKSGMKFVLCSPERHQPSLDKDLLNFAKKSGLYSETNEQKPAIKDADAVYTDTWVDMELFFDPEFTKEKERRFKIFMPYRLDKKLLKHSNALVMHDMPMHVGYEITRDVVESKKSIIFDQAENRLHMQKAILLTLLK